ncbi:MAG: hypothetical protein SGJ20_09430 [Planctomycetota bacterium]|nr:hypothetical protein [Planctomycetota bacterium]
MANPNRATLITKAHKVLKQHYKPTSETDVRPLMEQLLFAACLENAPYDVAEKVYSRLTQNFFDWNEVRVSTVAELAETMRELPEPSLAAANLKKILQAVFESNYSFDLELLKKQNISAGIEKLQAHEGITPFVLAYAVQHGLAGHFIPLDRGALEVLLIIGVATPQEVQSGSVSGLERAIPKNKGIEFGNLLHQLSADYIASPHSPNNRKMLLAINPDSVMPKRGSPRPEIKAAVAKANDKPVAGKANDVKDAKTTGTKAVDAKVNSQGKPNEKSKSAEVDKKSAATPTKPEAKDKAGSDKKGKVAARNEKPAPKPAEKKTTADRKTPRAPQPLKKLASKVTTGPKKKSPTKQLAKRKPR